MSCIVPLGTEEFTQISTYRTEAHVPAILLELNDRPGIGRRWPITHCHVDIDTAGPTLDDDNLGTPTQLDTGLGRSVQIPLETVPLLQVADEVLAYEVIQFGGIVIHDALPGLCR